MKAIDRGVVIGQAGVLSTSVWSALSSQARVLPYLLWVSLCGSDVAESDLSDRVGPVMAP